MPNLGTAILSLALGAVAWILLSIVLTLFAKLRWRFAVPLGLVARVLFSMCSIADLVRRVRPHPQLLGGGQFHEHHAPREGRESKLIRSGKIPLEAIFCLFQEIS
jgi:hypothetical protein